ncbi:MAG: 4-hydroxyphenylacetate 3-hydroxylase N-terminal domain-containing protein [Xanthobacteraceae bacterium]
MAQKRLAQKGAVMGIRDGKSYISGLKAHPREVWVSGRKVTDVTADPVFRSPIAAMARLYDMQSDAELRSTMTYLPDDGSEPAGVSFIIPRSHADLVHRRKAMKAWADASFGTMGRSPDFLNAVLVSMADEPSVFAECNPKFADNVQRYYRYCRDNDIFLTHTLVNPPVDRSKSASQQADPYAYLGIVEETKDGLIVRGAKMLATHGPTADEIVVYPLPFSVRPGEEKYALAFAIPAGTKGLRFICREPFDSGEQSEWDHPLGSRFEEPDAMAIFDDVLVPWDRVFLYGNVQLANTMFARTKMQAHTGHQTAVRGLAKCEFMTALAVAVSRSVKTDGFLHVQDQLGECLSYLQLIEGAIVLSEQKADVSDHGTLRPALPPLQALRYNIPKFYERMVRLTQVMGAGGILANPTEADLKSEIAADIHRYYKGADRDAEAKIRLSKLAWDATGTQFGQRQLQYERYYAGDPMQTGASIYHSQDHSTVLAAVERALNLPRERS